MPNVKTPVAPVAKKQAPATMWDKFFGNDNFFSDAFIKRDWFPAVNVKDKDNRYEVEIVAPGFTNDDFKVRLENKTLVVSAEIKEEHKSEEKDFTRREYSFNSFYRSFALPDNASEENIKANYENGVLKLIIQQTKNVKKENGKNIKVN